MRLEGHYKYCRVKHLLSTTLRYFSIAVNLAASLLTAEMMGGRVNREVCLSFEVVHLPVGHRIKQVYSAEDGTDISSQTHITGKNAS